MSLRKLSFLIVALGTLAVSAYAASYTETFDTSLGAWTTTSGLTGNGFNLGWQNTGNAGGPPGEMGGTFARYGSGSAATMPYILDTLHFAGSPLNLNSSMTFSGRVYLNDTGTAAEDVNFGYFNFSDPGNQRLVVRFLSPSTAGSGQWRFRVAGNGTSGSRVDFGNGSANAVPLDFSITWTASGLNDGAGTLSGTIVNGANTLTLPGAVVSANGSAFDSFGMWVDSASSTDTRTQFGYFDNISYVVTVPEPGTGTLILLGLGALRLLRRRP